jgi:metallo-beta-lactamase class B
MKKILVLMLFNICLVKYSFSQEQYAKFNAGKDIEIIKISDHAYVHQTYTNDPQYGRIGSNGLILINNGEAALFDTPMTEDLTKELVNWIKDALKSRVTLFVPNHWHVDCIGGLEYLNKLGVESYANEMTAQISKLKNLPVTKHAFKDSLTLSLGDIKIICNYPGAAHSLDNIVVWIPNEKILFAGCMAKEVKAVNLGNTVDGDLKAYPGTIMKVINKYNDAVIVIPGHGQFGGVELLKHTLELTGKNSK